MSLPKSLFVHRSPYLPAGRSVHSLDTNFIDWFATNWRSGKDNPKNGLIFPDYWQISDLTNPEIDFLDKKIALETITNSLPGIFEFSDCGVEWQTDNDSFTYSYYWVNSNRVADFSNQFAYLVHDGWLPQQIKKTGKSKGKKTYVYWYYADDSSTSAWSSHLIKGNGLDDCSNFIDFLFNSEEEFGDKIKDFEMLRWFLAKCDASDGWSSLVEDMSKLGERGTESSYKVSKHVCELRHNTKTSGHMNTKVYFQLVVFDDLWAASHRKLADSMSTMTKDMLFE